MAVPNPHKIRHVEYHALYLILQNHLFVIFIGNYSVKFPRVLKLVYIMQTGKYIFYPNENKKIIWLAWAKVYTIMMNPLERSEMID